MSRLARQYPAAALAVAAVLIVVLVVNINVVALVVVSIAGNILTVAVAALLFAQWTGGDKRRKKWQSWMLRNARATAKTLRAAF